MKLGTEVRDTITGFGGIITGKCSYITGCDQYLVQPQIKDGNWVDAKWFDVNRLQKVPGGYQITIDTSEDNGPCDMAPIK